MNHHQIRRMRKQRVALVRASEILRELGHDDSARDCDKAIARLSTQLGDVGSIDDEYPL